MADTINKPSIQIRSGLPSPLSDKSPSPATKLLISHGKPNFTIATRNSPKAEEDNSNVNPLSPQAIANNNYNPYKCANNNKFVVGTKFNGVFKPSPLLANGNGNVSSESSNEAAKVVLRRAQPAEPLASLSTDAESDDNVPEFIRRQRRIQERLAKENVLDFENRRSGYFTHVMISPDSPNRTSFVETMASPAIVPALEMPLVPAKIEEEEQQQQVVQNGHSVEQLSNGHSEQQEKAKEEEQQQREEQQKREQEQKEREQKEQEQKEQEQRELEQKEQLKQQEEKLKQEQEQEQTKQEQPLTNGHAQEQHDVAAEDVAKAIEEVNKAVAGEEEADEPVVEQEQHDKVTPAAVEAKVEVVTPNPNPASSSSNQATEDSSITISHTNGHSGDVPSVATPDPSGALGVNYEPKTVVSFAQELGGGENNYPDKVQVLKDATPASPADAQMQELSKLKFDIQNDGQNGEVLVTPVLRAD
ncbi:GH22845 [Drosophila grimshawi]|uniref:GH22845 n=1 Tax=Drosophila grimshawi TaxID=7222 RepID=B4JVY9_DROGR|nr:GH22845 [Drosophila grimshawi]